MLSLLVTILIFALIAGLIWWVIGMIPLPPPFNLVVQVVFAIICVIFLISLLLPIAGGSSLGYGYYGGRAPLLH